MRAERIAKQRMIITIIIGMREKKTNECDKSNAIHDEQARDKRIEMERDGSKRRK